MSVEIIVGRHIRPACGFAEAGHASWRSVDLHLLDAAAIRCFADRFTPTLQMVTQLDDWRRRAEENGIGAPRDLSRKLRCYDSLIGEMK